MRVGHGDGVFSIAVAARLSRLHPQTLRKYERAGLLSPARQAGRQRQYSLADLERLQRIQYLVESRGLNIAGLVMILAISDRLDAAGPAATVEEARSAIEDASVMSREPARDQP